MNSFFGGRFILAVLLLCCGVVQGAEGDGRTVKGTVLLPADAGDIGDVVVYVDGVVGEPSAGKATIRLDGEAFEPRVVAVTPGSVVTFRNEDEVVHSPYSSGSVDRFDAGVIKPGASKDVSFRDVGLAPLGCLVHAKARGYVLVVPSRYFARPRGDGSFEIGNVPPGRYRLIAWHENLPAEETWIDLEHTRIRTLEIDFRK